LQYFDTRGPLELACVEPLSQSVWDHAVAPKRI